MWGWGGARSVVHLGMRIGLLGSGLGGVGRRFGSGWFRCRRCIRLMQGRLMLSLDRGSGHIRTRRRREFEVGDRRDIRGRG